MSKPAAELQRLKQLLDAGFRALSEARIPEAMSACKQILAIKPDLIEGHFLVGLVATAANDRETAFQAFGSVTKLAPQHAAAWAQLAKLFMTQGLVNRADAALANAAAADPKDPMVQDLLGSVYSLMGEYDVALVWFEKANAGQPKHPPFMLNLANALVYHGRMAEAESLFNAIIALQPHSPQAHWSLATAKKAKDDIHIKQLRALVGAGKHDPRVEAFYQYAIGKECEDLSRWDEAYTAFAAGAKARRGTVEFDEAAEIEMFETLKANYTTQWLGESAGEGGDPSAAPIFILGQPRTGSTLIERIVTSHSEVHSAGELQQFGLAIRRLANFKDPKRFSSAMFTEALKIEPAKIGNMYIETTRKMAGETPRFVDKLPQNYLFIPLILKALPNAKIIHVTRNAADACFASFKQLFADAYLHSYDQEEMARHHCRYRELMAAWHERFPGRIIDVSYEQTVQDLEPSARALISKLDLPWQDDCLNFHQQSHAVSTASAAQVREPAHTRSVDRWRRYELKLAPMLSILREHTYAE